MLYKLTEKNLCDGYLSDDDFSQGLGFSVKTFSISDFPHSKELQLKHSLSAEKLRDRTLAIYEALEREGLTQDIRYNEAGHIKRIDQFDMQSAQWLAEQAYSSVSSKSFQITNNSGNWNWTQHYDLIQKFGYKEAHDTRAIWTFNKSYITGQTKHNIHPCVLDEVIKVGDCSLPYAAVAIIDRGRSARDCWGQELRAAPELLEQFPTDNMHGLLWETHEKRHLHQINTESPTCVVQYYCELDSDLAAETSLLDANKGEQTLEAFKHARYCGLLFNGPSHWHITALEDLAARQKPNNFYRVHRAIMEVRLRLAMNLGEEKKWDISSSDLQNSVAKWDAASDKTSSADMKTRMISILDQKLWAQAYEVDGRNPGSLYTGIRQLIEQNAFSDPLASRIAHGITTGAHYFNPDFIMMDYEPCRRRLKDRLRAAGLAPQ